MRHRRGYVVRKASEEIAVFPCILDALPFSRQHLGSRVYRNGSLLAVTVEPGKRRAKLDREGGR